MRARMRSDNVLPCVRGLRWPDRDGGGDEGALFAYNVGLLGGSEQMTLGRELSVG